MKFSTKDIGFILYNNRSSNMVFQNIDKNIDALKLIEIEKEFDWCKSMFEDLESFVEVDLSLLDTESDDIMVNIDELNSLSDYIRSKTNQFSEKEKEFLKKRNISESMIEKWNLFGLSSIEDKDILEKIGATSHPILRTLLKDGIEEGGICQPLFENDKFTNCSIRRISDVGKLKYTLAIPDLPVWGLDDIEIGDEIWICEGLFDMITLREMGVKSVTPSSAMWSGIQLYKLLEKSPNKIIIMIDNDRVGFKTGLILNKFFNLRKIPSITVHSNKAKDAAEHFLDMKLTFDEIDQITITRKMIESKKDDSFNFLKYLQTRKF